MIKLRSSVPIKSLPYQDSPVTKEPSGYITVRVQLLDSDTNRTVSYFNNDHYHTKKLSPAKHPSFLPVPEVGGIEA